MSLLDEGREFEMQPGPITQSGCRMKMADDFDCVRALPPAIAVMKFESVRPERIDEFDRPPQLAIMVACDCDHFAIFASGGQEFPRRSGTGTIVHKIADDDQSLRLIGSEKVE